MATIREAELPGLGKKYQMMLDDGTQVVVIIHDDGTREMFYVDDEEDEPIASISLTDQESRQLGSIIGGSFYQPKSLEKLDAAIAELRIEWLKVEPGCEIEGKSIGELGLRKNHGVIVIAALMNKDKGGKEIVAINPGPSFVFQPGQTVITAGRNDKMKLIEKMFGAKQ
ncbi:MAG TPA: TrkA C-terminal domain-containing protein [Bacillota bacterium]|nr:TrkA C-terminal domain-containing protein [Bacillota bacterium]